jgi:hypothetical protein
MTAPLRLGTTDHGRKLHAVELDPGLVTSRPGPLPRRLALCGANVRYVRGTTGTPSAWKLDAARTEAGYCKTCLVRYLDVAGPLLWPDSAGRHGKLGDPRQKAVADMTAAIQRTGERMAAQMSTALRASGLLTGDQHVAFDSTPLDARAPQPELVDAVVVRHTDGSLTVWERDPTGFAGLGAYLGTVAE